LGGRLHVVGAGLAGLSAALSASKAGLSVVVYEANRRAGGRLLSWHDARLGCDLDNGIHWVFSGQRAVWDYLREIGAEDGFVGPTPATLKFVDLCDGKRWFLRPNNGRIPWWILANNRNASSTGLRDLVSFIRLLSAGTDAKVTDFIDVERDSFRRFWKPLAIAALNTPAETASARELGRVLMGFLPKGEAGLRVRFPATSLNASFVQPAVDALIRRGVKFRYGTHLNGVELADGRASRLGLNGASATLGKTDAVVLALPPRRLLKCLPGMIAPTEMNSIVTVHYRIGDAASVQPGIVCLIDSRPLWTQLRGGIASVTVGAADDLVPHPAEAIAEAIWPLVAAGLDLPRIAPPPYRVVKERSGVFAHTPRNALRRGPVNTNWRNLFVAGDWIDTGVSATINSAVIAGRKAADAAQRHLQDGAEAWV